MIKKTTYTYYSTDELPYLLFDNEEYAKQLEEDLLNLDNIPNAKEKFNEWMDSLGYPSWSAIQTAFYFEHPNDLYNCDEIFDKLICDVENYCDWSCNGENISEKPYYVLWCYLMNKYHKGILEKLP